MTISEQVSHGGTTLIPVASADQLALVEIEGFASPRLLTIDPVLRPRPGSLEVVALFPEPRYEGVRIDIVDPVGSPASLSLCTETGETITTEHSPQVISTLTSDGVQPNASFRLAVMPNGSLQMLTRICPAF